ncbi:hypothetical protein [Arthrobacter sp. TMS2-4]
MIQRKLGPGAQDAKLLSECCLGGGGQGLPENVSGQLHSDWSIVY